MAQIYFRGGSVDSSTPEWTITYADRQIYEGQYKTLKLDGFGRLSGRAAKDVFQQSGLPVPVLSRIWSLVDQDTDGFINVNEFCAARHLVKKAKEGYMLPQTLPPSLLSASAPAAPPWGTPNYSSPSASLNQTWGSTNYASQSLPRDFHTPRHSFADFSSQSAQQSLLTPTHTSTQATPTPSSATPTPSSATPTPNSSVQGIGITVPLTALGQGWGVSPNCRRRYIMMFNTLDRKRAGFVSGQEARNELLKSHLDYGTLAKIWELADVDKDGRLSASEFSIAMHLCEKAKQGLTIPPNLPPELAKEVTSGKTLPSSKSNELLTLEDKRKDNFEKGRQELERRRQEIKAQQEKERAEKERKRLEEEEKKREKQRQEEERRRMRELERQRQIAAEQERERQRLALLREAEEKRREQAMKEEWARGRCRDIEVKCQVERGLVQRLQARKNDLEMELSQLMAEKTTLQENLFRQNELCERYKSALRQTGMSMDMRSAELAELKFNLQEVQLELGSVRSEYSHLSSTAAQSVAADTMGMHHQHGMNIKSQLETSLTSLRAQMTFLTEVKGKTKQQQIEEDEKLKEISSALKTEEKALEQLKALLEKQQKIYDEKKASELKQQEERRKQLEEKRKQEELKQWQQETKRKKELEEMQHKEEERRRQEEDKAKIEEKKRQEEEKKRQEGEEKRRQEEKQKAMDRQQWVNLVERPPLVPLRQTKTGPEQQREAETKDSEKKSDTIFGIEEIQVALDSPVLSAKTVDSPSLKPKPKAAASPKPKAAASPKPIVKPVMRPAMKRPISASKADQTTNQEIQPPTVAKDQGKPVAKIRGEAPSNDKDTEVMKKIREMQQKRLAAKQKQVSDKKQEEQNHQQQQQQQDAKVVYKVLYDYQATRDDELTITEGDTVKSYSRQDSVPTGWLSVEVSNQQGLVPESYLQVVQENSSQLEQQQQPTTTSVSIRVESPPAQDTREGIYGNVDIAKKTTEEESFYAVPTPRSEYINIENFEDRTEESGRGPVSNDTTSVLKTVKVISDWSGTRDTDLSLKQDQLVSVVEERDTWYFGKSGSKSGWFPKSCVQNCEENKSPTHLSPSAEMWQAIYDFIGEEEGDLTFTRGEAIEVLSKDGDWWMGRVGEKQGIFPGNYVRPSYQKAMSYSSQSSLSASPSALAPPREPQKRPVVARVVKAYTAVGEGQLSLTPGCLVHVKKQLHDGWWEGELQTRGQKKQVGWFPCQYVEILASRTKESSPVLRTRSSSSMTSTGSATGKTPPSKVLCHVLALYTYNAENADELTFHKGSVIGVLSKDTSDWWYGDINGRQGLFPCNYVQSLDDLQPVPGSKWAESVPRDTLNYLTQTEVKRQEAIFELVTTEQSYTESLKLVKEVFFDPMEKAHVLTGDELSRVKVNWDELIQCSEKFSSILMSRLRSSKMVVDRIGRVLIDQIPTLKGHIRWCSCQLQACTILQNKTSNPFYREFEQKCSKDPRTKDLPLSSFLLKPMQRVTKYPLLIKRIIDYTPESHSDMDDLRFALDVATSLCSDVNEGVRSTDNTDKLEWLQHHVQVVGIQENLVFNSLTNFMGLRKILYTGKVIKLRGNKPLLGFLFNDFLLLAKPSSFFEQNLVPYGSGHFILYRTPYILDKIKVTKEPNADCFRIISEGEEKEIVLKAENEEARDSWLKKVVSASVAFSQAKRKRKKEMNDKRRSSVGMATLEVHVIEAADLKGADITGKSDPFCVIKFANQEQSTQHIPQTCSPKWNEKFVFQVHNPQSDTLEITVFDKDIFSPNDFLGCAKLPLSKLLADGPGPWKKRILLEDVPKGEIELEINLVG